MRFLTVLILLSCTFKVVAQSEATPFKRFGFQAGANYSNMNFNAGYSMPALPHQDAAWKTGFTFGFMFAVPISDEFLIQPEFNYSQRNGSDISLGIDYHFDFVSVPLLLSFQPISRLSILLGPQIEILINASSDKNGVHSNITHDVEERGIGIIGCVSFDVYESVFISARYFQGVNHVGIGQRTDVKEFKYQSALLTAGIRF